MTKVETLLTTHNISRYAFLQAMGVKTNQSTRWQKKLAGERSVTPQEIENMHRALEHFGCATDIPFTTLATLKLI